MIRRLGRAGEYVTDLEQVGTLFVVPYEVSQHYYGIQGAVAQRPDHPTSVALRRIVAVQAG